MNTHILWATHNRNHWEMAGKGSYAECEQLMNDLSPSGDGYVIHNNEIVDSWTNSVLGIHYDLYADETLVESKITSNDNT